MKLIRSPWLIGAAIMSLAIFSYRFYFGNGSQKYPEYQIAFDQYLSAYTEGVIGRKSAVLVRFSSDQVEQKNVGQELESSPYEFSPSIHGKAIWTDSRTLAFHPSELLPSGTEYRAKLHIDQVNPSIPDSLSVFEFAFMVRPQELKVEVLGQEKADKAQLDWHKISGTVHTTDFIEGKELEKLFVAEHQGENLAIKWEHYSEQQKHLFTIDSIQREQDQAEVLLAWNGDSGKSGDMLSQTIEVPAKGNFIHTKIKAFQAPNQHIAITFSDPISPLQDIEGLVHLGEYDADVAILGNTIKVYPKKRLEGEVSVMVEPGIKNIIGVSTKARSSATVLFDPIEPAVELIGKGTILPSSNGKLPFLFKAVGLNAIDIRIIKIFENNVPQFLQLNNLPESDELRRVGREIMRKRIDLSKDGLNLLDWNVHSLDLSELIQQDPGAIYEVAIGFKKEYALCDCEGVTDNGTSQDMLDIGINWDVHTYSDFSYWSYYSGGYSYRDKDNPCLGAYYNRDRVQRKNILASDMGLIAKMGTLGNMQFIATSLQNTDPLSGVEIEVYNYQQQLLSRASTNRQGIANVSLDARPYIVIAKKGEQRGYLRLDDGKTLSLSRFDTQGAAYHQGVKGYLYGERGVWRPGDPMYLTFILEDEEKRLPDSHPVTFELFDPRGQLVTKKTTSEHLNNFYDFRTVTAMDAPTGNYLAKVSVGGASFQKSLKVETVMPNRLKIKFDFDREELVSGESSTGNMQVTWLHGAIARSLKANVEVSLTPDKTSFPKYDGYIFDDPVRKLDIVNKNIFDGTLDENGLASVPTTIKIRRQAAGKLKANFNTKVFEPGGNFSVDFFSMPYHPYQSYVGLKAPKGDRSRGMLLTDTDHEVKIATLDPQGNPVTKGQLEVKLYKLDWKWWWDKSEENIGDYRGRINRDPIQEDVISTINGEGSWKLRVNYPDWGRYLLRVCDPDGHCTGKVIYIDWPGWAGRGQGDNPGGASMLVFSSEKTEYEVGDDITLNIPTGNAGKALISIESGQKILQSHWVDAEKGTTRFSFKATPDMAPNIYANVMLLQPHQQTSNDLPIRLYGVIPIKVEDPATKLEPMIAMNDVLGPMEQVNVRISESEGRPMTYTLAVVDEGLLDLTRFKTPSPWHEFYKREALKVKTWDVFNDVIGAYGGEVQSLLGIGGDGEAPRPSDSKQDRFKPVVVYMGPFTLEAGETKNHSFKMPNYVGSVRTMVIAGNDKGAFGSAEKATPVKKPLMALATLPRVIGPGESFDLPVTVFALEDDIRNVKVEVEGDDLVRMGGLNKKNLRFTGTGDQMVTFSMKARASVGRGTVKVTAISGRHIAKYEVDIDVRAPNPRIVKVFSGTAEGGQEWSQSYQAVGIGGTNHAYLEVSAIPPINMSQRLKYLIRYPYGCIEQTTSSVFPQLYLASLLPVSNEQATEITGNIKAGIKRLRKFQLANGGFSYWPGHLDASNWGTNYVGHFLIEAKKAGYSLPNGMLENWKVYQAKEARRWVGSSYREHLAQSYRLYLLALSGSPEIGAMNRMRAQSSDYDNAVLWNLAGAYQLAGQSSVAQELAGKAGVTVKNYRELGGNYGSTLRDQAMILQVLSIMKQKAKATPLMQTIAEQLSSDKWLNTQSTAFCLLGIAKYVGANANDKGLDFSYKLADGNWAKVDSNKPLWQWEIPADQVSNGTVNLRNDGGNMLFARVVMDGIPKAGDNSSAADGLSLDIVYKDMAGNVLDPINIKQGTDFKAEVTVKNTGREGEYEELALSHTFPSGWEIHNNRMSGQESQGDKAEYQDVRDDRINSFFDLQQGESKTFVVMLNASYLGKFYMPTVAVEAMYDKRIHAHQPGGWVNVIE